MRSPACVALVLALLAASCGGNVLVDSGSSTTTGAGVSCVDTCQTVVAACPGKGPPAGCAASCQNLDPLFDAACPTTYQAYLTCIASHPTAVCTNATTECAAEITAFVPCSSQVCNGNPTICQ